jgi:hypothetical protein
MDGDKGVVEEEEEDVLAGLLDLCFLGWLGSSDLQQKIFLMVADMSGSFDKEDDGLESGRDEEVGMRLGSLARSSDASDNFLI